MNISIRYSDGTREEMTAPDDIEILRFIVGGAIRSLPYGDGKRLLYSDQADRKRQNVRYKGRQLYGAIVLIKEGEFNDLFR